jgi:hypothetical protein
MKTKIGGILIVVIVALGFGSPVYAQESQGELTQEQRQALTQIAEELEQIEQELHLLSLAVAKLVLEEQAAELQRQIALAQAMPPVVQPTPPVARPQVQPPAVVQEGIEEEEETAISTQEEPVESPGEVAVEETPETNQFGLSEEEEGVEEEEDRGFLAAFGPLGNLGTPELAVLAILAILVVFMVIRRLRGRGAERPPTPLQPRPTQQPQVFQSTPIEPQQSTTDKSREEFKQQVAWK